MQLDKRKLESSHWQMTFVSAHGRNRKEAPSLAEEKVAFTEKDMGCGIGAYPHPYCLGEAILRHTMGHCRDEVRKSHWCRKDTSQWWIETSIPQQDEGTMYVRITGILRISTMEPT